MGLFVNGRLPNGGQRTLVFYPLSAFERNRPCPGSSIPSMRRGGKRKNWRSQGFSKVRGGKSRVTPLEWKQSNRLHSGVTHYGLYYTAPGAEGSTRAGFSSDLFPVCRLPSTGRWPSRARKAV